MKTIDSSSANGVRETEGSAVPNTKAAKAGKRLIDKATKGVMGLSDRMMDWGDEMGGRFNDMAADPENKSIAARMIRTSESMIGTIEDQQRVNGILDEDDIDLDEDPFDEFREEFRQQNSSFVFYTMDTAPKGDDPGTPVSPEVMNRKPKFEMDPEFKPLDNEWEDMTPPEEDEPSVPIPTAAEMRRQAAPAPAPVREEPKPQTDDDDPFGLEQRRKERAAAKAAAAKAGPAKTGGAKSGTSRPAAAKRPAEDYEELHQITPLTEEERKKAINGSRKIQYWTFMGLLAIFCIAALLLPLRPSLSKVDNRYVSQIEMISIGGLWDGSWFDSIERWYSDSLPGRDKLAEFYDKFSWMGFDRLGSVTYDVEQGSGLSSDDTTQADSAADTAAAAE